MRIDDVPKPVFFRTNDPVPSESATLAVAPSRPLPVLQADRLACRRGDRVLFHDLDFALAAGQMIWLRGNNGCGKTSLLRLLGGLGRPESGDVLWDGEPIRRAGAAYLSRLVFVGHTNALKGDFAVHEALHFMAALHQRPCDQATLKRALETFGVASLWRAAVRTLSQGQKRRVALARLALETEPSVWILDEPFDALDVGGIERLNGVLNGHLGRGGSIILTSHQPLDSAHLQPAVLELDRYR